MLAIGERYRSCLEHSLLHIVQEDILWLPDNPELDQRLAGHADLGILAAENNIFVGRGIAHVIVNQLTFCGTHLSIIKQGSTYPDDVGLCVCQTEDYVIYNPKTISIEVIPHLRGTKIPVNQGYARCSTCAVSHNSIITADTAIAKAATAAGMDALMIRPGYIQLDGYDYGFIGGATIKISDSVIAFTGTLDHHPDQNNILAFLKKHGHTPVFLTKDPIFDIGGAVALP